MAQKEPSLVVSVPVSDELAAHLVRNPALMRALEERMADALELATEASVRELVRATIHGTFEGDRRRPRGILNDALVSVRDGKK